MLETIMPSDQQTFKQVNDRNVLQNGYQLQHYQYAGNPTIDGLAGVEHILRYGPDDQYYAEVRHAQQMLLSPKYKYIKQHLPYQLGTAMGLPEPPDTTELMASGSRTWALAEIERYRKEYAAVREKHDPGGRKQQRAIELMDRRYTEEKRKCKEKRQRQSDRCATM